MEKKTLIKKADKKAITALSIISNAGRLESADMGTYRSAVNAFKSGNRQSLYKLIENYDTDPFLANAIGKLIDSVTNANLVFLKDGENVEEIDRLIDTDDFEELLEQIAKSVTHGKTVTEVAFSPEFKVYSIPQRNIVIKGANKPLSQREKYIAFKESDRSGYDFTKDEYMLECGKDDSMGAIYRALPYAIYKRDGFADWAQNVELFAQPTRVAKYNSWDIETRDILLNGITNQGGSNVYVMPKEAEFDLVENKTSGSHEIYKGFIGACNEEMLIALIRNLMTTLSGSSRSQAEVHQEAEENVYRALRRHAERVLNSWFINLLIKRGYNVAGGYFSFPDAGESISTEKQVEIFLSLRNAGLPVDDDHILEITGIPKVEKTKDKKKEEEEKPAKEQKDTKTPENEKKEKRSPKVAATKSSKKTEKEQKLSDDRNYLLQLYDKTLGRLFPNAPTKWSGAYQNYKRNLKRRTTGKIQLADSYEINIDQLINEAIREVYGNKGEELINKKLFDITNDALQHGVDTSLTREDVDDEFVEQFKTNTAVFAAFKNHSQTKEIAALLYTEEGKLRSFREFKKLALQVSAKYNEQYLQTEYNTAVRAARMAANLKKYEKTKHLYPNLEYMLTGSPSPRHSHLEYVGTILPIEHEAWAWLMPPSDWNCDCSVRPTDKEATEAPVMPSTINPLFVNNPAITAEFVNTKETPYYKHTDAKLRNNVAKEGEAWQAEYETSKEAYKGKKGGYLEIVKQDAIEREKNLKTYKLLADDGGKYTLLSRKNIEGVKDPDAFNYMKGVFSDAKHPEVGSNIKTSIQNLVRKANKQGVKEVVVRLNEELPSKDIYSGISAAFQPKRNRGIERLIIIRKDRSPLYFDVEKLRMHLQRRQKK